MQNFKSTYFFKSTLIVILMLLSGFGFQVSAKNYTIPFTRAGNLILVTGKIGQQSGNFILDTGAPYLVLNETYFNDIRTQKSQAASLTSTMYIGKTKVEELVITSNHSWKNLDADVVSLKAVENAKKVKVLGLLGIQLFRGYELTINYSKGQLYLIELDRKGNYTDTENLPIKRDLFSEKMISFNNHVYTFIQIGNKKLRACIDTGAESCVLHNDMPNKVWEHLSISGRFTMAGVGNSRTEVLHGKIDEIDLGKSNISNTRTMVSNLDGISKSFGIEVDFIIGYTILAGYVVSFNFVNNTITFATNVN